MWFHACPLITSGSVINDSNGIGESSNIPVAGAIANAVFDAVGVRITDLPVTADKVLAGLRAKGRRRTAEFGRL